MNILALLFMLSISTMSAAGGFDANGVYHMNELEPINPPTRLNFDPLNYETAIYSPEVLQLREQQRTNELLEERNRELRRERIHRMYSK